MFETCSQDALGSHGKARTNEHRGTAWGPREGSGGDQLFSPISPMTIPMRVWVQIGDPILGVYHGISNYDYLKLIKFSVWIPP